jgi:transcriptional regulator with XRE-family HTH domain
MAQALFVTVSVHDASSAGRYSTDMVTQIRKGAQRRVYLKAWREHRKLSAEQMAGRLGIARESYYRWEGGTRQITPKKMAALAAALDIEPNRLWEMPPRPDDPPSLDEIAAGATREQREMFADVLRRMMGKAS